MNTLVNTSGMVEPIAEDRKKKYTFFVLGVLFVGAVGWGLSHIKLDSGSGGPKRQTVKISLPDTPPPPPPPKQEEKKPEPKEDNKPAPQMEQKQMEAPPQQAAQSLKMEGAAGDGPSMFSSGTVAKDYAGGAANTGAGTGTGSDRAKYQFYVTSMKQLLKDALERNLRTEEKRVTVTFSLWIGADGRISRFELMPIGNDQTQAEVQAAFEQASRDTRFPAPGDTPQPLRLRMTLLPPAS